MRKVLVVAALGGVVFVAECSQQGPDAQRRRATDSAAGRAVAGARGPREEGVAAGAAEIPRTAPESFGQLETPPVMFKGGVDGEGREFYLNGQPAENGKLIFTASNGFFEHGACVAMGESKLPKVGDEKLIRPNFAYLGRWKQTGRTIRWHVWIAKPSKVRFNVRMKVAGAAAGSQL